MRCVVCNGTMGLACVTGTRKRKGEKAARARSETRERDTPPFPPFLSLSAYSKIMNLFTVQSLCSRSNYNMRFISCVGIHFRRNARANL